MIDSHSAPTKPIKIRKTNNILDSPIHQPVIKVIGLGGAGSNAIDRMLELGIRGVEFIAANTDHQALSKSKAANKIQLGPKLTRGLGAGGQPSVGQAAAEESWRKIAAAVAGADMVFLTAGMGGGTGTGSIPVAAKIVRAQGAVAIAVVTTPFSFEMGQRQKNASNGLEKLQEQSDTLISIPNDRLLLVAPKDLPLDTAFRLADDVLRQAVQGITELILEPGLINVDFAHIRRLMKLGGGALMAIGHSKGENKAINAIKQALNHPLLGSVSMSQASGVIVNFTAGEDLSLIELSEALIYIQERVNPNTEIVMGTVHNKLLQGRAQVILVITGIGAPTLQDVFAETARQSVEKQTKFARHTQASGDNNPRFSAGNLPVSINNLDMPAFLRREVRYSNSTSKIQTVRN